MNNARRQQQNAEVINKSTRSRFSTWKPPSKKKEGKGGKGRGRGNKRRAPKFDIADAKFDSFDPDTRNFDIQIKVIAKLGPQKNHR